jgi:hypothetical protein
MKRRARLTRTTGLAPRSRSLCPTSSARRAGRAAQAKAYEAAADAEQAWCSACGKAGPVEHSHILSQGQYERHRNNPLNWLQLCRTCHNLFEHKKAAFAHAYPAAWAESLRRMELVDAAAFRFFQLKNETLFL